MRQWNQDTRTFNIFTKVIDSSVRIFCPAYVGLEVAREAAEATTPSIRLGITMAQKNIVRLWKIFSISICYPTSSSVS
jgi:hypothetical protein